jgi:hypothetical protein
MAVVYSLLIAPTRLVAKHLGYTKIMYIGRVPCILSFLFRFSLFVVYELSLGTSSFPFLFSLLVLNSTISSKSSTKIIVSMACKVLGYQKHMNTQREYNRGSKLDYLIH